MAKKTTPVPRPSKASSSKKSGTKQPTSINGRENAVLENAPVTLAHSKPVHPEMEEEIRRKAYQLYEERGRQDGFEQEDWVRAEAQVRNKYQPEKSA
jgi:hypothetical protein